jgi:DNA-binding response OmpR family regulator
MNGPQSSSPNPRIGRDAFPRRVVLVVDDDESLRNALGRLLRLRGFEFAAAASVGEALDAILMHRPSAAIIQLELPSGTGRDVVVSMPPRVPVIMCSTDPRDSTELERLRPRTRLMLKPCSLVLLIEALEEMLQHAESVPER